MSTLIKGMKMPKMCLNCRFLELSPEHGDFCILTKQVHFRFKNRPKDCPLIEIPPHGRLIDADALVMDKGIDTYNAVFAVANAPTIIPAEGERT